MRMEEREKGKVAMFARVMRVVSPCVFLTVGLLWGFAAASVFVTGFAVGIAGVSVVMSWRSWSCAVSASDSVRDGLATAGRVGWSAAVRGALVSSRPYVLYMVALYALAKMLTCVLSGVFTLGGWDALMFWYVVDAVMFRSQVELVRIVHDDGGTVSPGEHDAQ